MKQFTFTLSDPAEARRLEEDLRRDPRIYTRTRKSNGQNNVNKQFKPTRITVAEVRVISEGS
jgi:hypothetical protein